MIPAARPLLTDRDAYNGGADLRDTIRRMIAWEQFTYARDCAFVPGQPDDGLYVGGTAEEVCNRILAGETDKVVATVYVPESLTTAQRIELRLYVRAPGAASLTLRIATVAGTGGVATVTRSDFVGWVSVALPMTGPAVVQIRGSSSGGTSYVDGASGWWQPGGARPDVTITAGSTPTWISQAWAAEGRPDSTYLYRWLVDHMHAFAARRPRQFLSAWWLPSNYAPGVGATGEKTVARFRFLSSPWGGPATRIRITAYLPAAGDRLRAYLDGALWNEWTGAVTEQWSIPTALAATTLPTEHELELRAVRTSAQGSPSTLGIGPVHVVEEPLVPALPGGQTVPASFPSFAAAEASLDSRSPTVLASQRADLVKGMIWLWANRRRWVVGRQVGYGFSFGSGAPYLLSSKPDGVARDVVVHQLDASSGRWTRATTTTADTELTGSELPTTGRLVEERFPAAP